MKNMKEIGYSNYCISRDGDVYSLFSNRLLRPYQSIQKAGGYVVVNLIHDTGKKKVVKVHRLVALTYIDNPENKPQVNHIDGDKLNNSMSNLEWVTPSENMTHAQDNGLCRNYNSQPNAIVPNEDQFIIKKASDGRKIYNSDDVHSICSHLEQGYRICDVAKILGINVSVVKHIKSNRVPRYSDIVSTYDFSKLKKFEQTCPEKVLQICRLIQKGLTNYAIANEVGVDRKVVEGIKNRRTFSSITKDFIW